MYEISLVQSKTLSITIHRFSILRTDFPLQHERLKQIKTAVAKMNTIKPQRRLSEALARNILPAANRFNKWGRRFHVLETKKLIETLTVIGVGSKMLALKDKNITLRNKFNTFQVKRFYEAYTQNLHIICTTTSTDTQFRTENLTEVIMLHDARSKNFTYAIKKLIRAFKSKYMGTCNCKQRFQKMQIFYTEASFTENNDERTSNSIYKARLGVQEHRGSMKSSLVNSFFLPANIPQES